MKFFQARIVTNDVPRLIRFYRELTGLTPTGDDRYAEFHGDHFGLAISSQQLIEITSAGATAAAANRSVILDFEVEDVDSESERLRGLVSHFVLEPTTQPWGNRAMLFRDPDGNLINFFTDPRNKARATAHAGAA